MGVAIVLVVLIVGSVLFHLLSPWYFTPIASNWGAIDDTISITFWVTGVVFVVVNLFMAYAIFRYRHRPEQRAHYEPENKKLEWWLLGVTAVGVAAMLAPGLFVWAKFVDVPKDAAVVEASASNGTGSTASRARTASSARSMRGIVSDNNPFGINPDDPDGQDDIVVNSPEVHLPLGKPIKVLLRSNDVLHNFSVRADPREDGSGAGPRDLCLVHADAHRQLRPAVRGAVRHRPLRDARQSRRRGGGRVPGLAGAPADLCAGLGAVAGDAAAGQALYAVCAACHGAQGRAIRRSMRRSWRARATGT